MPSQSRFLLDSSPRGGAFGKPVKLILAEQSILYRKMPGLAAWASSS